MAFKSFINKHGTKIATAGSIVLTIVAVVTAIKKSKEGTEIADQYADEYAEANGNAQLETEAKLNYAKNLVKTYKETFICAAGAIVLGYISHRADAKKIANLGAALALNEEKVKKLYNYIENKMLSAGKAKRDIEKDIVESDPDMQYDDNPIKTRKRYRKEEPVTFKDSYSGTLFESTMKDYDAAVDRAELILLRHGGYGLGYNKWRNLLGLEDVPAGATTGWKPKEFKSYLQESKIDGATVYIICYKEFPNSSYWK